MCEKEGDWDVLLRGTVRYSWTACPGGIVNESDYQWASHPPAPGYIEMPAPDFWGFS